MAVTDQLADDFDWAADTFPLPLQLRHDLEQLVDDYSIDWNLPRECLIYAPWGTPILPLPPDPDATGPRVWETCDITAFEHPVFWLPADILRTQPDESAARYLVRLSLELIYRELISSDDARWTPVFSDAGHPTDTDDWAERVEAYLDELSTDPLFTDFVIDAPRRAGGIPLSDDEFQRLVDRTVEILQARHDTWHAELLAEAHAADTAIINTARTHTFPDATTGFLTTCEHLATNPDVTATDLRALRATLDHLAGTARSYAAAVAELEWNIVPTRSGDPHTTITAANRTIDAATAAADQLNESIDRCFGVVAANPNVDTIGALVETVARWWTPLDERASELIAELDRHPSR